MSVIFKLAVSKLNEYCAIPCASLSQPPSVSPHLELFPNTQAHAAPHILDPSSLSTSLMPIASLLLPRTNAYPLPSSFSAPSLIHLAPSGSSPVGIQYHF